MFSVVLLNYHRPSNIQDKILPILVELEDCAEIIISHGKKETFFESSHAKVICRDDSTIDSIWGVGRRFLAALDCRSDIVVFLDDDVLPIPKNLIELVKYCMAEPERLHGSRDTGRVINNQGYFARVPQDGKARVILTQCVAAHKTKIQNYIEWIQKPENLEILLILQNAKPVFNGEDITFSLASGSEHKFYQNLNMNGLPSPHAICNMSGH